MKNRDIIVGNESKGNQEGDSLQVSYANRGMAFEKIIEYTNKQYLQKGRATIQKVATPWKVIRRGKKIISAYPEKKSTVDFIGVYNGRGIAFDAKSTRRNTSFSLSYVGNHQYNFLKRWHQNGGISFLLVEFVKLNETYLLPFEGLQKWWEGAQKGGRKSIPYDYFQNECDLVKSKNGILLDYLSVIDRRKAK